MHGVMALAQLFVITSVCGAAFGSCEFKSSLIHVYRIVSIIIIIVLYT